MKSLSAKTFQCGVTVQGLTTLSGTVYLTALTNTATWDYVVVGTTAQGQLYTRTYAQLMSDITSGIGLSGYVPTSRTLTINGVSYDLTANRSWTISTVDYTSRLQHQVKAGVAINKGQAVYVTSADGTNMIVGLASNASEATSSKTMGLLDATVSTNGFANVVTEGLLAGLDTTGATAAGDPVWLGTGGNLIYGLASKPYAPAHLVFIGIVTRRNVSNGEIFVKVQNGFELNEIHDVDLITTAPINGHLLGYNGTLWVNKTIAGWLGYTPANASGTTNYISKFTGSTTLGNSQIFDNGTNVGIGTASPSGKLQIADDGPNALVLGSAQISTIGETNDGGYPGMKIVPYNSNIHIGISSTNDNRINLWHGGSNYAYWQQLSTYTIFSNYSSNALALQIHGGNVGIGTTTPTQKLEVNGSTWVSGTVYINRGVNSTTGYLYFDHSGTQVWKQGIFNDNTSTFSIGNGGGFDRLFNITNAGNVGIGTTSPSYKLQVNADGAGLYVSAASVSPFTQDIAVFRYGGNGNAVKIENQGGKAAIQARLDNGTAMDLSLNASGGNVGIGIASPSYKLDVAGDIRAGGADPLLILQPTSGTYTFFQKLSASNGNYLRLYDGTNYSMFWKDEKVGIGTSSPSAKFQVVSSGLGDGGGIRITNSGAGGDDYRIWPTATVNGEGAGKLIFTNNVGNVLTLTSGGNVGIGTISPSGKLEVYGGDTIFRNDVTGGSNTVYIRNWGTGSSAALVFGTASGDDSSTTLIHSLSGNTFDITNYGDPNSFIRFGTRNSGGASDIRVTINPDGNVGIGTTNPAFKFEIGAVGSGYVSAKLTQSYEKVRYNNFDLLGYSDGHLWMIGNNNPSIVLGSSWDWDNQVEFDYVPNTVGAAAGVLSIGQTNKNNANYTHGITRFFTNGSERLRIDSTGNVGIGTTTPSTLLDVSGVITATGGNSTNWNTAYGWGNHASASYVPQARTLTINGTSYDLSANRSWTITTATPGGSDTQVQYNSSGTLAGASALTYNSTTNRVGINQASPGYDLDVNGQVRVQDKLRVGTVNSGNGVVHMSSTATINASATTIVWAQNVSVGMCAFIEYYILNNNSLTDQRAGTIIVTWNQSGTPTIAHTETTTPDIGSTTAINFTSSLVGSDARINAVSSSPHPYTIVMSYKYF